MRNYQHSFSAVNTLDYNNVHMASYTFVYDSGMKAIGVINHLLIILKTHSTSGSLCLVLKYGQESMVVDFMGSRVKDTIILL